MAKVEHTSDARVLVGIDISKHRHEVLISVPGKTRRRRLMITNSTDDFMRLISILREYGLPVRIGFEATGNYHRVLMYHLGVAGFDLKLVSSVALADLVALIGRQADLPLIPSVSCHGFDLGPSKGRAAVHD